MRNFSLVYGQTDILGHNYNSLIHEIACILMFYSYLGPTLCLEVLRFREQRNILNRMDIQNPKEKSYITKKMTLEIFLFKFFYFSLLFDLIIFMASL